MPIAEVNGQKIHYQDTGGDGPALIFSHGFLMDHEMFAPQLQALADRCRCIAWDERGHGQTAAATLAPFSYYDSADDLAALLRHLGIRSAVLAGMSQGGFLSMRCALTHPEVVRALVLIDTQSGLEKSDDLPVYRQMTEEWANHGLSDEIADTVAAIILGEDWSGADAWKAKWREMTPANLTATFETLTTRDDITDRLGEISVPTLIIHGDADRAISLEKAKLLAERIPDARMVVVEGAGHAANLTHPEPVNAAISEFMQSLER